MPMMRSAGELKKVVDDGVSIETTRYFYDDWQVCEEQDENSATLATYVYGLYIDEVLNMQRGGSDFFCHADELYNVRTVTSLGGNVAESYEYGDYGEPTLFDETGMVIASSAVGNPYLFTSRRFDSETRFYYYRTRYLEARGGRFITRDNFGIWGDYPNLGNGFSYVALNPPTNLDPFGLQREQKAALERLSFLAGRVSILAKGQPGLLVGIYLRVKLAQKGLFPPLEPSEGLTIITAGVGIAVIAGVAVSPLVITAAGVAGVLAFAFEQLPDFVKVMGGFLNPPDRPLPPPLCGPGGEKVPNPPLLSL